MQDGWYYLHQNGSLIYKRYLDSGQAADFRESSFVQQFWPLDTQDRESAWRIVVEATALGADKKRVAELADLWACDDIDAQRYADHLGIELYPDGTAWCASRKHTINLQECPHGFGDSGLEAMADLCKQLGYRAQKTWGPTFKSLVECPCDAAKTIDAHCASAGMCTA